MSAEHVVFFPLQFLRLSTTGIIVFYLLFCISIFYAQVSFSGNVDLRLGESRNGFYYNESLINTQLQYGQFFNWIQFEFSDPPELGRKFEGLRKLRLEYKKGPIQIKLGDLYEIWGRGLILNSMDDQSIDRDTGIRGMGLDYDSDLFNFHFLTGSIDFSSSTIYSPGYENRTPNYTTRVNLYGLNIDWILDYHLIGITYLQSKEFHPINSIPADTLELKNRLLGSHYFYSNTFMDITVDYVKNWSMKFNQEKNAYKHHANGRGLYGNVNVYLPAISVNLEYVNYRYGTLDPSNRWNYVDNYGMVQDIQNPPIANVIHETTLLNRVSHQTDFNNEVGVKLELMGSVFDTYELMGYISKSSRSHTWLMGDNFKWKKEGNPALFPMSNPAATPFNAVYGDITGFFFNYALFTKVGYSFSEDMIDLTRHFKTDTSAIMNYTYQSAKTIPLQIGYTFPTGWSIDAKIETQWLRKGIWQFEKINTVIVTDSLISEFSSENGEKVGRQHNSFISMSIGKAPTWTMAFTLDKSSVGEATFGFADEEETADSFSLENFLGLDKNTHWVNLEFVYNVNPELRLSIMYGSLKGGLLCANGVCRIIEPFDNGLKMAITAVF